MTQIKYRELQLKLADGVTLVVDVASKDEIKAVFDDLAEFQSALNPTVAAIAPQLAITAASTGSEESPDQRLELRAGLDQGFLKSRGILAFKDDVPQLLRPTDFNSISDATLTLIFAVEAGLRKSAVGFDDFRELYDAQNIKSGSQLSMLLNNLKNAGYIDRNLYKNDRTIRLTAKGEKKVTEVLKGMN